MNLRPGPQRYSAFLCVLWRFLDRQYRTVGYMPDNPRFAVADDALTNARPQTVGADQRGTFEAFAIVGANRYVHASVVIVGDRPSGVQSNQGRLFARVQ